VTLCADKVAYLSEHLATNAATLHRFVHPDCPGIEPYSCPDCTSWHIGHPVPGARCKSEEPVRPWWPKKRIYKTRKPPHDPRGAA
jgi:hypothetical protein